MSFRYPISLNLVAQQCVVVGGGLVALRKTQTLLAAGAQVRIISPELSEGFDQLLTNKYLTWTKDIYHHQYLDNPLVVIAATNQRQINKNISDYCHQNNILVNVVDSKEESDFIVNSSFSQGDLRIAVSTNGQSPLLAAKIIKDLQKIYGPEYTKYLEMLGEIRLLAQNKISDRQIRKQFLQELLAEEFVQLIKNNEKRKAREKIEECLLLYLE